MQKTMMGLRLSNIS